MSDERRKEIRTTFNGLVEAVTKDPEGLSPDQVGMIRATLQLVADVICDVNRIADAADVLAGPPAAPTIELKIEGGLTEHDLARIRQAVQDLPADGVVRLSKD
jgi:hypothetical protein